MENRKLLKHLQELDLLDLDKAILVQGQFIRDAIDRSSEIDSNIHDNLGNLIHLINSCPHFLSGEICMLILQKICMSLLQIIHLSFDGREQNVAVLGQVNKIILSCLNTEDESSLEPLFELCCQSLKTHVEERSCTMDSQSHEGVLDLQVCLDVVLNLVQKKDGVPLRVFEIKSFLNVKDTIFTNLLSILNHFQNPAILSLSLRCISNILRHEKELGYLNICWELFEKMWTETRNAETLNIYLCGLSNFFFPMDDISAVNVRSKNIFWKIVQDGLNSSNSLTRKQSLYLIKRNVDLCEKLAIDVNLNDDAVPLFRWSKDKQKDYVKMWEDLIMLLETFEEKQIHVIKPLLPRLQTLLKAASTKLSDKSTMLHTSWLSTIFRRGISHESITLVKWMTEQVLYLDLKNCPIIQQGEDKYLTSDFLHSIQDTRLFFRPKQTNKGTIPACGEGLIHLFQSCWKALETNEQRCQFFTRVLETLSTSNWGPVPLMFICQALSCVPKSEILGVQALLYIRKIVTTFGATSGVFIRGAIQSFCVRIIISLTNTKCVTPKEFSTAVSLFDTEDGLARGTTLWADCVNWIQNVCQQDTPDEWLPKSLNQFLKTSINSLLQILPDESFSYSESEVVQVTRFMLLTVDSGILPLVVEPGLTEPCMTEFMMTLVNVIVSIPNHPYMSHHKAERAIEILISLLKESGHSNELEGSPVTRLIKKSIQDCLNSLLLFTTQMLLENWKQITCVESVDLFVEGLLHFLKLSPLEQVDQQLVKLTNTCIHILMDSSRTEKVDMEIQIKKLASMGILSSVSSVLQNGQGLVKDRILSFSAKYNCTTSFEKPISDISHKEWGKIASLFISYQWKVMEYYLSRSDNMEKAVVPTLKVCQDSLSVCGGKNTLTVYRCIGYLLSKCKVSSDTSSIIEALSVSWSHVQAEMKCALYWEVLEEFIKLAFQPALLQKPREPSVTEVLFKYACELMELGRERTGVANILIQRLCGITKTSLQTADSFYSILGQAAMFGSIFRKQDRQLYDVFAYIESLGKQCSVNELKPHSTKDVMVRVEVASLICSLSPQNGQHQDFAFCLLKDLIQEYNVLQEESYSTGTITNSLIHRKKNRLLQIVTLLEPFVDQTNAETLWKFLCDILMQECQPSVRHSCEWIIMRMVLKKTEMIQALWSIFDKLTEKKSTVLCSIMCMMSHLGLHLPSEMQERFYSTSFEMILPWCMGNHFNTRVHAAATLLKQWKQCTELGLTNVTTSYSTAHACLTFHQDSNNLTRNIQRLSENFFFQTFDPLTDFSLETIFQTLPVLFEVPDDEWISPPQFELVIESKATFIPIYNPSPNLRKETPGSWRFKYPGAALDDSDSDDNLEGDFQKKIMPWRLMLPDDEVQDELDYCNRKREEEGLIVVTSLIDKVPNLGGLCRTSEIFGVSQYVIGKMAYMEDKVFKELSVTAHKWLPITEVWFERLPQYLTEKRQEGYTLIGVEQTANSVCLTEFTFPKKSLLLLGNEKEGIPVQLINQLDVCVEIPQQGVIRSLNVHVSGALLIWEYRRQQLISQGHSK